MSAEFFLVVPPGLEELALAELNSKVPGLEILQVDKGGVKVRCPIEVGFALNLWLKIPSGILLRIAEFKCRDLPKLFQKISNIKWAPYYSGTDFQLSVSSSKSRLLNEKKIAGSVAEGIQRHFAKQPPPKVQGTYAQEIMVRFYDDLCTISLNTSGELLFKRGYKTLSGVAPIRENLAAALYKALLAARRPFSVLVDPMCGTGTLLLEALLFDQPNTSRSYAFEHLSHKNWPKPLIADLHVTGVSGLVQAVGMDRSAEALQQFQQNRSVLSQFKNWGCDSASWPQVDVISQDFFSGRKIPVTENGLAFICNPPYNERIKLSAPPQKFYLNLIDTMAQYSPELMGVIIPDRYLDFVPKEGKSYRLLKEIRFLNGGLPVTFRMYIK